MNIVPEDFRYLIKPETRANAYLATTLANGSPHVTPVWFTTDGEFILINTARGRVKDNNMTRRPRVAVLVVDPGNPYRYIQLRGQVVEQFEDESLIHRLSKIYTGVESFKIKPGAVRVTYKILPEKVATYDWKPEIVRADKNA